MDGWSPGGMYTCRSGWDGVGGVYKCKSVHLSLSVFSVMFFSRMTGETPEVRSDKRKPRQIIEIIAFG